MPPVYEQVAPGQHSDRDKDDLGSILDEAVALQIRAGWEACEAATHAHELALRSHVRKDLPRITALREDVRCVAWRICVHHPRCHVTLPVTGSWIRAAMLCAIISCQRLCGRILIHARLRASMLRVALSWLYCIDQQGSSSSCSITRRRKSLTAA